MNAIVTIRNATQDDSDRIAQITIDVFEPASMDAIGEKMLGIAGASWQQIKTEDVRNDLRANPEGCFVAEMNGQVVGYVTTSINRIASRGSIANLAVVQPGKGIGRKLIQHALSYFRSLGLKRAHIATLACNEIGQHLYPDTGFQEVCRQIHYGMNL